MKHNIYKLTAIVSAIFLLLTGCTESPRSTDAYFAVYLEDAPADFRSITVNITSVELLGPAGWEALPLQQTAVSLLTLTGGVSLKLAEGFIAPGDYTRLRITFRQTGNQLIQRIEGADQTFTLTLEEADAARELALDVKAGGGSRNFLIVDMDATRSIVGDGQENYALVPYLTLIDLSHWGAISGAIATSTGTAIAERMHIEVTSDGGNVTYSFTNPASGRFFVRVVPGTYTMRIIPAAESGYLEHIVDNLVVRERQAVMLGPVKPAVNPVTQ